MMKKIIVIIIICFLGTYSFAQSEQIRSKGNITVVDSNFVGKASLRVPVYDDSSAANGARTGLDSTGKIIYVRDSAYLMVRTCCPKRWVKVGSGSGGGSINITNDILNTDSLVSIQNGTLGLNIRSNYPTRSVEYVNKSTFTSLPSDMTAVGSPTYTISGGKINFSGTGGGGVNNISKYIRSNFGVLDECNTVSATITVGAAPDANSYGASVGFKTYNIYGATQNLTAGINMATGANFGKIYVYSDYTATMYYGAVNTDINNGDVIKISLITQGWTLRVLVRNYTQGWVNELSLPNVGGFNPLTHNSAYPAFFHNGGTVSVDSFNYVINRPVLTDIMFIGNSLTYGQGATQEFKRWVNKVGYSEFNIFSGGGSDVSQNIVDRLPHIISCNPRRVILHDVVGNDIAQAISSSIWMPNLRTIRNTLVSAGIEVIFTTGSPRTGLGTFLINQVNFIDTCADFAGDRKIDTWTALLGVGTEPYTDYFTDGVHYNDRGHEVMANTVNIALGYESNPGIRFGQNTLFSEIGYGSIYANETYGLTIRAGKGTTNDLTLFDRAGNSLMSNPTGSTHLVTALNFGVGMAGVAAPDSNLTVNLGSWFKRGIRATALPTLNNNDDSTVMWNPTSGVIGKRATPVLTFLNGSHFTDSLVTSPSANTFLFKVPIAGTNTTVGSNDTAFWINTSSAITIGNRQVAYATAANTIGGASTFISDGDHLSVGPTVDTTFAGNFSNTDGSLVAKFQSTDDIADIQIKSNSASDGGVRIRGNSGGGLTFITSFIDALTINSDQTIRFNDYGAGTATFDASGNITSVSDVRLKNVLGNYSSGVSALMQINPIVYKYNSLSGLETNHQYIGFSAQNIKSVLGEGSYGINRDGYLSIQDRAIMATMVNAIKELKEEIEYLKTQIKK